MSNLKLSKRALSKTIAAVGVIVIIVLIAVAGYVLYQPAISPSQTTSAATTAPGPTTVVVDRANELQSVDPAFDYEYSGWEIIANVYQTLVTYDHMDSTKFVGVLAENWTVSPDGLTYTFTLRQGVKFSNGDPFD